MMVAPWLDKTIELGAPRLSATLQLKNKAQHESQ
jgi:hypothetical protein